MATWDCPPPDYRAIAEQSHFSKAEVRRMHQRFQSIAYWPVPERADNTWLTKESFMQQPELVFSPLAGRAFDIEAEECGTNDYIDFRTYVRILSHFSPKASLDEKRSYMRRLFGEKDGAPTSKASYINYIREISSHAIMPHIAEQMADEIWKNVAQAGENKAFSPTGPYDIEILMTIPF